MIRNSCVLKKVLSGLMVFALSFFVLSGCGDSTGDSSGDGTGDNTPMIVTGEISDDTMSALDELNSYQLNYAQGVNALVEIPEVMVKEVYDNWDNVNASGYESAPIMLREYVDPAVVYLDYSTDCSIAWNKDTGVVDVEYTDVSAREDYKQKEHK